MSGNALASRYAQALFDAAEGKADKQLFGDQLAAFVQLLASDAGLAAYFADPSIGAPAKRELIRPGLADFAPYVQNFLCLVCDKGRQDLLPAMSAAYRQLLASSENRSFAQLYTASALDGEQLSALTKAISQAVGSQVELSAEIDPALLGGVKLRMGDTVIDGSLAAQLKALRKQMTE